MSNNAQINIERQLTDKKALEFTIESSEPLDEEQDFLAIRVGSREDESGWFNLFIGNGETGDYEYATSLNRGDDIVQAAIDYMVEQWEYERERLSVRPNRKVIFSESDPTNFTVEPFPKIVCLCGSTRFMAAFQEANLQETLAGNIVLSVGCNTKSDAELFGGQNNNPEFEETKRKLDELHKLKIDLADEILVLSVGGYIGDSTRSEIEYAKATGKPIRYLEPWNAALDKAREEVQSNA